jgi:diguanylate cyclase (GGDEF)-like protein
METLDYNESTDENKRLIFDLTTMLDIGKTLNSSLSLDDVLDIIILTCNGHFHASDAVILLSVEKNGQIFFEYTTEDDSTLFGPSHPFIRYLQDHLHILHTSDLSGERYLKDIYRRFSDDDIELIVPLQFKGAVNGILCLKKKEQDFGEEYTDEEKRFIEILAGFASVAIENARLYEMATLDRKTGLYNHGFFQNRLIEEIGRSERYKTDLTLMMIDLDHFKQVNDSYGHMMGDEVLIKIAGTIQEEVRSFDIPARFGGEEFTVILPETSSESALIVAERLRSKIGVLEYQAGEKTFRVTISIGVAGYRHDTGITEDIFIEQADKALYHAKRNGRDRVVCYDRIFQHMNK